MFDFDVAVVGGGPAGLATAIACSRIGLRTSVVDSASPPIDKGCGEGLMPGSLEALAKLGIELPADVGTPIRGIAFIEGRRRVQSAFSEGCGTGVRRMVLHQILTRAAERAGVKLFWNSPVRMIRNHTIEIGRSQLTARWIAGADGARSRVRAWTGLAAYKECDRRYGFRRHYSVEPWSSNTEIYWGRTCQVYVTPVSQYEICVALLGRDPQLRLDEALKEFPELSRRLAGQDVSSRERGSIAATVRLRRVAKAHFALVGDASGTIDPIAGEGLYLAFRQAMVLAESLGRGGFEYYAREHKRLERRPRIAANLLLLLERSARLRRIFFSAVEQMPWLLDGLLAAHAGQDLTKLRFLPEWRRVFGMPSSTRVRTTAGTASPELLARGIAEG